mmetsp:Transcript_32287/g.58611  ORF Transcript_32287/g.58611 Transcript_32287/m.58611 type:complete len:402 (-) Transcript_32287:8-1213(-)
MTSDFDESGPRRLRLWKSMMRRGITSFISERPDDFRRRACRGIPSQFRAEVWKAALGCQHAKPGVYQELLSTENKWLRIIEIDMPRTFPDDPYFDDKQQQSLLRVLHAYSNMCPDVGYCQGMNYVAGFLLLVAQDGDFTSGPRRKAEEEETFWMFVALMDRGLSGFYQRTFPLLRRYLAAFDELVAETMPELQSHFDKENVQHAVYLHQWCLTLFIGSVPRPMALTFWDAIVCGGLEELLPIAVSLLGILSQTLLSLQFEEIVRFFQSMRTGTKESCNFTSIASMVMDAREELVVPEHIMAQLSEPCEEEDLSMWTTPGARTPAIDFEEGESPSGQGFGFIGKSHSVSSLGDYVQSWWEDTKESLQSFTFGKSTYDDSDVKLPASIIIGESQVHTHEPLWV